MIVLHGIRHGETDWNRQGRYQGARDIPLNETGRHQALRLATSFRPHQPVVVSSPLARAAETARILAEAWDVADIFWDPLLKERSYGLAEGLTLEERKSRFPGEVPGMETIDLVKDRARRFLSGLDPAWNGREVVVVSHGGFLNALLAYVSDGEVGTGKTLLANASVSSVEWNGQSGRVIAAGATWGEPAMSLKE